MKIHFISGLPRSGSTLLVALLRQHPDLWITAHSPVLPMLNDIFPIMGDSEYTTKFSQLSRTAAIRGIIEGFHMSDPAFNRRSVAIDGNRMWTSLMPLIADIYPDAKVICCVRPLGEICNSFEKMIARNYLHQPAFRLGNTVHLRVERWMERKGIIGGPLSGLADAMAGEFASRILVIEYAQLCAKPQMVIDIICDFLRIPRISVDVNEFHYADDMLDSYLDCPGLHTVNGPVRAPDKKVIIPEIIYDKLNKEIVPWMT